MLKIIYKYSKVDFPKDKTPTPIAGSAAIGSNKIVFLWNRNVGILICQEHCQLS
jgi:hypothetical protein